MSSLHNDPLVREETIRDYLLKRLAPEAAEDFESHYLACEDCFSELAATQEMAEALSSRKVHLRRVEDVVVLQFTGQVDLTRESREYKELVSNVFEQKDKKVLVDLSRVSRIDSGGLGLLMHCYSHLIRDQGMLKLLNPSPKVKNLLALTHLDTVLESYPDERQACESFRN